jgi:hypothetical protein
MRLARRVALVAIMALAGGAWASSGALAAGPGTDACSLVSSAEFEHIFGMSHVSLREHVPVKELYGLEDSACVIVGYRGSPVSQGPARLRAIEAGRAVVASFSESANVASPCTGVIEPPDPCPETAEQQFQSGLTETKRLLSLAELRPIELPAFGAEAETSYESCRIAKVCQIDGTWWSTQTHSSLLVELSVKRTLAFTIKSDDKILKTAVGTYFG